MARNRVGLESCNQCSFQMAALHVQELTVLSVPGLSWDGMVFTSCVDKRLFGVPARLSTANAVL